MTGSAETRSGAPGVAKSIDYLVLTALPHEREAVLSKLPGYTQYPKREHDVYTSYGASVASATRGGVPYRVVVMSATGMGPAKAAALTSASLRQWRPKHVLLVGIAGGIPDEVNVGDVVVAPLIVDYLMGKVHPSDERSVRWTPHEVDEALLDSAMNFHGPWQDQIAIAPPDPQHQLHVHTALIASGGDVMASKKMSKAYAKMWDNKLGGFEMEAALVQAVLAAVRPRPAFLMVRGVSDPTTAGRTNKTIKAKWRAYAADIAAAYAIGLIRSGPSVPIASRRRRGARGRAQSARTTPAQSPAEDEGDDASLENILDTFGGIEGETLRRASSALRSGRAVLVAGPLAAIDSGLPSAAELTARLRIATATENGDADALLEQYVALHGRREAVRRLSEWLDDWNLPLSPLHQIVPALSVHAVVTLSVDRLFEEACRQFRRPYIAVTFARDLSYTRVGLLPIVKLNGSIDRPHTMIAGGQDRARRRQEQPIDPLFARDDVQIVMVAIDGTEPDLSEIIDALRTQHPDGAPPVALVGDDDAARRCRELGMQPILLRGSIGQAAALLGRMAGVPPERWPRTRRPVDRRSNPFRRLDVYREEDAPLFVGRENDVVTLLDRLASLRALLLFGASGVGKSSFLRAGLIPAVRAHHPGMTNRLEIADARLPARWEELTSAEGPLLILLDQFERFFDGTSDEVARAFLFDTVSATLRRRADLQVVFVIRRDRLADVHPYRHSHAGLFHESQELAPLDHDATIEVLQSHFAARNYRLSTALAEHIADRTTSGNAAYLPALQLYGHALFEHVDTLRVAGSLGGDIVDERHAIAERDILQAFVRDALVVFAGGEHHATVLQVLRHLTRNSRRQELSRARLRDEFPDPDAALTILDVLVDRRLVRYVPEHDTFELVHDTLVEAIEEGPLAIETDYSHADLLRFLLDDERRKRLTVPQITNLARFSLRRELPLQPWLALLAAAGISRDAVLLDLARDADDDVAAGAMNALRRFGTAATLAADVPLRRYLHGTVMAGLHEGESPEKTDAALRLLIHLGLQPAELPPLLDVIDPWRGSNSPSWLEARTLTPFDQQMIRLLLPEILRVIPLAELETFGRQPLLQVEPEMGPELFAELLAGVARRGLMDELRKRFKAMLDVEDYASHNSELVARALVLAGDATDATFDEERVMAIEELLLDPRRDVVRDALAVMRQLAPRKPDLVMRWWLDGFARWSSDEELWPVWRRLAESLLGDERARELFLRYSAAVTLPEIEARLTDVIAWAAPLPSPPRSATELASERMRRLCETLDSNVFASRLALVRKDDARAAEGMTALDLWRMARVIGAAGAPPRTRWETLVHFVNIVLKHAADGVRRAHTTKLARRLRAEDAPSQAKLHEALTKLAHKDDSVRLARAAFCDVLREVAQDGAGTPSEIAASLLILAPLLECENPYWPPLGCPPELWGAIERLRAEADRLEPDLQHRLREAYDAWSSACARDLKYVRSVATWALQRAAQIAADDGSEAYENWFRGLRGGPDDRSLHIDQHARSVLRWALQRADWPEEPWWILMNDPRQNRVDESEITSLLEVAAERAPNTVSPIIRGWLGKVFCLCVGVAGFSTEAGVGAAFARLTASDWLGVIAPAFDDETLARLLDDPAADHVRAGLRIWSVAGTKSTLPSVAHLMLRGPRELRRDAVEAIETWFAIHA